jgi:hypothetical protein
MNKETYTTIIDLILNQLAVGEEIDNLDKISELSQVDIETLRSLFPSSEKIILAIIENAWSKLALPDKSDKLSARDQIFDGVMMAFDHIAPYRTGIKKMTQKNLMTPTSYTVIAPRLAQFGSDIVRRYVDIDGPFGVGVSLAFNGAFATTFWTFLDDDTFDLSKTMASLDTSLKTVASILSYCPGIGKIE